MLIKDVTQGVTPPKGRNSKGCYSETRSEAVPPSASQDMEIANAVVATRLNFEPPPSNHLQYGLYSGTSVNPATTYSCASTNMSTAGTYSQSNHQSWHESNTHPEVKPF